MSKADNMLSILWSLRSGRRITAQQLANELEVHIRTIYRCIDSLCVSGVPIIADSGPNGGYQILGRFAESPLLFDMEEQKALVHASTFAREAGYPFKDALNRAVDKLKHYTNEEQLDHIERHLGGLSVIHPPIEEEQQDVLRVLEEAAAQGTAVQMEYVKDHGDAPSTRVFDPYGIIYWKSSWYAVGFCSLRQELRSFRTDRIIQLQPTERRFERPTDFSPKAFLMHNLLPNSLNAKSLVAVRIQGHEQSLDLLCQHWLFGHALVERKDGEALFKLGLPSLLSYVPYFLLSYGKSLTIIEPYMLVEKLADVSTGIVAHYEAMKSTINDSKG
jgi:predicted DNA-binding transcriptional regulator YafY